MKKTIVTIGIPAYNEEASCVRLVRDILAQAQKTFSIHKIIIYSDGSTDATVASLKGLRYREIVVIAGRRRKGIAFAQNEIISYAKGDILVLLNADVVVKDKFFLQKLIAPIRKGVAEMTSGNIIEANPTTFVEKVLYVSMLWKHKVFATYRNGDNLYTCHGPCRAFSKNYYSSLYFPPKVTEDAYTYLLAKSRSLPYRFVKSACVTYKLPSTLKDHENQSKRFSASSKHLQRYFDKKFINEQYRLPLFLIAKNFAVSLLQFPVESIAYVVILLFIKMKSISYRPTDLFDIVVSSKEIAL